MKNLIFAIFVLFAFTNCAKQDDKPAFPISEEEKQAIQLLVGKWKYVYDYSESNFRRDIYYNNRPPMSITEADIVWQNEGKQDAYPTVKYTFTGKFKTKPNKRENGLIDAYFYASYKTKMDTRLPAAFSIYISQPDTLRLDLFSDRYILLVKEK